MLSTLTYPPPLSPTDRSLSPSPPPPSLPRKAALTKEKQEEQADQLRRACVKGNSRDIATLAKKGADVNLRDCKDWQRWAPLHYSVAYGQVAATEALLDLGAEVNMQDWVCLCFVFVCLQRWARLKNKNEER
jgi:ankyrin repeat protein